MKNIDDAQRIKICRFHIEDDFVSKSILENGERGKCKYCESRDRKVVQLSLVLEYIKTGIKYHFEEPVESRYLNRETESGFDGPTYYFDEVWDHISTRMNIKDTELYDDIYKCLNNNNYYVFKDEFGSESEYFEDSWQDFKDFVMHEARFVFAFTNKREYYSKYHNIEPKKLLEEIQDFLLEFDLFRILPVNSKLYRCRQYKKCDKVKYKKDIASPPLNKAIYDGRMNPAGISFFYCSLNKQVSIKEAVDFEDKKKPYYSTVFFRTKEDYRLLDLSDLPQVPSICDGKNNRNIDKISFLKGFVLDITRPVERSNYHIDYVPTQVITEYFRFNPNFNIDGIIYPSSKISTGHNIVLFFDHETSLEKLDFQKSRINRFEI